MTKPRHPEIVEKITKALIERFAEEREAEWPDSIQKEGKPATYEAATWEWARRMANSKGIW